MTKLASKLDWTRMLGFEQIAGDRSMVSKIGAKVGSKTDIKLGLKVGAKIGVKIGSKNEA